MGMDREFHKQLCAGILLYFCSLEIMAERSADNIINIIRRLGGGLATYQQIQIKSIQTLVAFALHPSVPFRASSSKSTIGSKYCVLPLQPLSRLGARSGRFVPYVRANTGGKAKSKSDREVVFEDVCLLPNLGWSNVPRCKVKETLLHLGLGNRQTSLKTTSWSHLLFAFPPVFPLT